ncbi:TAFII55 protein conserved region-domain-containing protein [Mycena floridula]|nr:TAFII55 protein conserved region-domain-containing protein [Mycena floridula]
MDDIIDIESDQAGPSTLFETNAIDVDVETLEPEAPAPPPAQPPPAAVPASPATAPVRGSSRLKSVVAAMPPAAESAERTTRSAAQKSKSHPKLKFKLSEKAAAQAPGMSFLGQYDRELDSDDEELTFEEQFVLRMPPGEDCEKLRKMVASREIPNDVWFKFKDSRRAVFHIGNNLYSAKLVDLPCIIESQKTLDNKQMFKVADICQMLVVEKRIENDEPASNKNFNFDEFIWPHGLTPPLHHVRKRRFRKRINKRTIESVEQEVERLLDEDSLATEVKYDILDNINPDMSDSELLAQLQAQDEPMDAPTPADTDAPTPGGDIGEGDEEEEEEEEPDGDIDEELAAELDLALGDGENDGDDEDDDDDESEEDDEDDDDDDEDEEAQTRKLLNEEIRDLEAAVAKKGNEIASSSNPLIKKRFEDALKKLTADLESKLAQREEMRLKKAGVIEDEGGSDSEGGPQSNDDEPEEEQPNSQDAPMEID